MRVSRMEIAGSGEPRRDAVPSWEVWNPLRVRGHRSLLVTFLEISLLVALALTLA
jgi:hypothetical protein